MPTFFCDAKYQNPEVSPDCIKPVTSFSIYKSSLILNFETVLHQKKVTVKALREVNLMTEKNEIIQHPQNGSEIKASKKGKCSGYNK